jgi:hypothetical protein
VRGGGLAGGLAPGLRTEQTLSQGGGYSAGFTPAHLGSADASAIYAKWKREYLKSDCGDGTYRVEFQSPVGSTVSEGVGYGMLLTVYFGDKAEFDGLWRFARKNLNSNALLGWKVTCAGFDRSVGGAGSATDGDVDIAMALVAAVDQWGAAYRAPALEYLKAIKAHDFIHLQRNGSRDGDERRLGQGVHRQQQLVLYPPRTTESSTSSRTTRFGSRQAETRWRSGSPIATPRRVSSPTR